MEKYLKPEIKVEEYKPVDVLTESAGETPEEPTTQSYTTPYIPIP